MRMDATRPAVLLIIPLALAVLVLLLIVMHSARRGIDSGPPAEITLVLAWNGEAVNIPAPLGYPRPQEMYARKFPWLRDNGSARVLTTFDAQGKKYTADMHGLTADPRNPGGRLIPSIASVARYDPNGRLELSTGYSLQGPSYWSGRDPNGVKNIEVTRIGIGLNISFHDAQGRRCKEWLVNKRGQVYQEQIRQEHQWTMTHDLQDLKTAAEVPWGTALREFMEYCPGRSKP